MKVLVTDANNRVALAVVRALGRAGIGVTVVEQERFSRPTPPAFVSRFVQKSVILPDLGNGFVDGVADVAREVDVVLPVSTNVLLALAENRDRFPRLPVPGIATIRKANDKSSVLATAARVGVPVPRGYAPECDEEIREVADAIGYPAVVKMRDDAGTYLEPGERYRIVENRDELLSAAAHFADPVIQERIPGDGFGCGFLAREGELLAAFCHRRRREYPVTGGPSALCESVIEPKLVEYTRRLAREFSWTGVAMAEFKQDADGDFRLLEINPRFWGSLPLAIRAGVNFPESLCKMALGFPIEPIQYYKAGLKVRFLALDVSAALQALRRPGYRKRFLGGFMRDLVDLRISDGVLDRDDWRASVAYVTNLLGRS